MDHLRHDTAPDRQHLVRYLLNLLPEDEAERLDMESISDDRVAAHLRIAESDLVDDYVLGGLTGATLERFEASYLSSARRRENVKLAARFLSAVERAAHGVPGARVPSARVPGATVAGAGVPGAMVRSAGVRRATVLLASAAALVIAAGGAFMLQRVQPPLPTSGVQTLPARPADAVTPKSDGISRPPLASPHVTTAGERPAAGQQVVAAALVLWPQTRGADPLPTLVIAPGRTNVVLELTLESTVFARYRAALEDPAGNQVVWRSGWSTPQSSGNRTWVRIAIPTTALRPQHYAIELSGQTAGGVFKLVDSYVFRVAPR